MKAICHFKGPVDGLTPLPSTQNGRHNSSTPAYFKPLPSLERISLPYSPILSSFPPDPLLLPLQKASPPLQDLGKMASLPKDMKALRCVDSS